LSAGDAVQGWWPASLKQLLGSKSLANRNGPITEPGAGWWASCSRPQP
jgi:hypothetical protein